MLAEPEQAEDAGERIALILEVYKNYDQRRQNLNDRRSTRNAFYSAFLTTLLSAVILARTVAKPESAAYLGLATTVGLALCALWFWNLKAISTRTSVIHDVLREMEADLPAKPYTSEFRALALPGRRGPLHIIRVEMAAPVVLASAFAANLIVNLAS